MQRIITITAAALALAGGVAEAGPASPPAKRTGPCDGVYASAAGLSDYRFDGFSESNHRPTWQVTAYCYRNDGYFVGTMLTGIDFEDSPRTHLEADWYVGRQVRWKGASWTMELLYSSFPDKRTSGPSYDLFEPQVEVSRTFRRWTLGGLVGWETNMSGGGQEWRVKASAAYAPTSWLTLSGHAGRFFAASGSDNDHDHWDIGATARWRRLSLDARYGGTDQPRSRCFFTDWCEPGPSVSLAYRLLP